MQAIRERNQQTRAQFLQFYDAGASNKASTIMAESSEENRAASIEIVNDPIRDDDVESVQEAITHEDLVFKHLH